ncbi:hypothetical protein A2U01_0111241, partial [Trifolium medium]|nr:hypothetical protein [Trifolium medium]
GFVRQVVLEDASGSRGFVVSGVGSPIWGGERQIASGRGERVLLVEGDSAD